MADLARITHVAYGDESSHTSGPYGAVAIISMPAAVAPSFASEIEALLAESSVRELKWHKLKSARDRFAVLKILDAFCARADRGEVRANVLVWDFDDSRHAIKGRDDHANLGRLYYHLCESVFRRHWPQGATWGLYPDELHAMRWTELQYFLQLKGLKLGQSGGTLTDARSKGFDIAEVRPVSSISEPLVQLADFFAGIAVYSRTAFETYGVWSRQADGQEQLFLHGPPTPTLSAKDRERCTVMRALDDAAKARKWGVALASTRGFQSHDWRRGMLSFWFWTPQHFLDKAPTKVA